MSDILSNWLNNEIELSQSVTNIEQQFSNGYLFGEVLYKFNQQSNFKSFSKKDNVQAKQDNFKMLEPTLRNLKIKFDTKMVDSIMKGDRGVSLQLLYQLKMSLEKVYPPTDIAVLRKTGKMGDNQPALKIAHSKEQYDKHNHEFFKNRLQEMNKPQKTINMDRHLKRFDEEKDRQQLDANKYHQIQLDSKDKMKQEIRKAQINKLQRNAGFMEEWLQKGVEDWKKNQTSKKDREHRDLEFQYKQAEQFNNFTNQKIEEAGKEVHEGISKFETTLQRIGIKTIVKREDADRALSEHFQNLPSKQTQKGVSQRFTQSLSSTKNIGTLQMGGNMATATGGITLTSTGLRGKDKKGVSDKIRKERERRRRKTIVDQAKTHTEMEHVQREKQITERMKRQSKQEDELQYEGWRTGQCKNIIIEDRKLRETRYEKRRELDQLTSNYREEEMLRQMRGQMDREMETTQQRDEEMRILGKQAHRERRNEFGYALFDAIFDIANEAYILQQKSDSQELDSRNLHEWLRLFVEERPIAGSIKASADFKEGEQAEYVEEGENGEDVVVADPNQILDDQELVDYLKNQGQWPTTLITENPPNLEQFLTGQTDAAPGGAPKGKAAPAKAAAQDQIVLEEGDTELPHEAPSNFLLGDAVEIIINLNFDARAPRVRPKMPQDLPLKLCFVGYQFSGKKTQAQRLKEELGLDLLQIGDLIREAHEMFLQNAPIEGAINLPEEVQLQDIDLMSADSEDITLDDEAMRFKSCGEKVNNYLLSGEELPDELYIELIVAKIRLTYDHKSKAQLRKDLRVKVQQELEIKTKIASLEAELEIDESQEVEEGTKKKRKRDPAVINKQKKSLEEQLVNISQIDKKGWILVDFPTNFSQSKLLETALSGYVPSKEEDPIEREKQVESALLLVQPNAKEVPPVRLMKSGMDAVLWFDVTREECTRRALGRRYDSINEKVYHIHDQPPMTTSAPLCERLVPLDEMDNSESTLIDRWMSFDHSSKSMQSWLGQFGDAQSEQCVLRHIDANQSEVEVFNQIMAVVDNVVQWKITQEQQIKARIEGIIRQKEEEEKDAQRKQEELLLEQQQEAVEGGRKVENKVEKPDSGAEKVPPKKPSVDNIDTDMKPVIYKVWEQLSDSYKMQMKSVFRQVRTQRERVRENLWITQTRFLDFLNRPDVKQEKLEQFIKDFNDFSDQYPDLREDEQTKDELHQRVDILIDELWEITEERKDQSVDERKKIMENGWIEYELGLVTNFSHQLMQSEVDKFKASVQLIHDYFHTFEDKLIPEAPPLVTAELVNETEELPAVEVLPEGADPMNHELYTYPRIDKLFEKALKTQVVPDVTQIQAQAADKKGAPAKGKDPKAQVDDSKSVPESHYVKEMKATIKIEKSILRYRVTQIRNWALKCLKEMRQKSLKTYGKLEDWIYVSQKTENDAADELAIVLKRAIETETKMQEELRIKFMDFCVDEKIMNFIEPPLPKLPALEEVRSDRYSIEQLTTLVGELESLAKQQAQAGNNQGCIPNKLIVDLFVRKLENSSSFGDEGSLPINWRTNTEYEFTQMIRNLDKYNQGVINWRNLATFIILLKTSIATDKNVEAFNDSLHNRDIHEDKIDRASFLKTPTWFDDTEVSVDRDYSEPFTRVQFIKELLFRVNKVEGEDKIMVKKLMNMLKAKELTMVKRVIKTYEEILIAPRQ